MTSLVAFPTTGLPGIHASYFTYYVPDPGRTQLVHYSASADITTVAEVDSLLLELMPLHWQRCSLVDLVKFSAIVQSIETASNSSSLIVSMILVHT